MWVYVALKGRYNWITHNNGKVFLSQRTASPAQCRTIGRNERPNSNKNDHIWRK